MTPHALIAPARLAGIPLLRTQTDERLVDLVRAGNDAAFEAIVSRYRGPLLRYCSTLLPEGRADDAVQQTFLLAYDSLRGSHREMCLRPWLYRIAHNTALNALRDRGLRHEQLSEQIDGVERPDQAYEKGERLREVVAAVGMLPDRQRDAIVQRELEGRSYDEIALSIGVSNGAVRQLLNRARTTLRAGATAITPFGILARVPWASGPSTDAATRVAELCGGATGGAVLAKVCATALVTGAVLGGVATTPDGGDESKARATPSGRAALPAGGDGRGEHPFTTANRAGRREELGQGHGQIGRGPADQNGSGEGSGQSGTDDSLADRRGSVEGDDHGPSSNSGPGSEDRSGADGSGSGESGPGSGSGDSGSGSGSDSSGSDSGSDNSGPGSDPSGSTADDSSGSGSAGLADAGSSGSGGSGSGTSGSTSLP